MLSIKERESVAAAICGPCVTSRTCTLLRKGRACEDGYNYLVLHPVAVPVQEVHVSDFQKIQADIEADISDAHQAYCDVMKTLGEPVYVDVDPRPDLSATCGCATSNPCPGCCKEKECEPDHRPDSAEIDHDDPINQE